MQSDFNKLFDRYQIKNPIFSRVNFTCPSENYKKLKSNHLPQSGSHKLPQVIIKRSLPIPSMTEFFLVHRIILLKSANTICEPSRLNSATNMRNSFFIKLYRVLRNAGSYSSDDEVFSHLFKHDMLM